MIAQGVDPNDPKLEAERVQKWQAAQTITQAEAKKLLPAGRRAVWAQLKAPSTAKLVSEGATFRCLDGSLVAAYPVDAQNSFGATLRDRFCAFVEESSGNASVIDCVLGDGARLGVPRGIITGAEGVCELYSNVLK